MGVDDLSAAADSPTKPARSRSSSGKRGPKSAAENSAALGEWIAIGVGLLTDGLETIMREEDGAVALTDEEAEAIAAPLSRMASRTDPGKRFARYLGGHEDGATLAKALGVYLARTGPVYLAHTVDAWRSMAQRRSMHSGGSRIAPAGPPVRHQQQPPRPAGTPPVATGAPLDEHGHGGGASNGHGGAGDAAAIYPRATDFAEPPASGIIELYPGGIRPIS